MNCDTQQSIRVASFNCNSIRKKIDTVRELLDTCDLLLCQLGEIIATVRFWIS